MYCGVEICIIGEKLKINVDIIQYNSIELILLTRCLLRRRKIWKKGSTIHVYYYTRVRIHVYACSRTYKSVLYYIISEPALPVTHAGF